MQFPFSFFAQSTSYVTSSGVGVTGLMSGLLAYFTMDDLYPDSASTPLRMANSVPTTYYLENYGSNVGASSGIQKFGFYPQADDHSPAYLYTTDASGIDFRISGENARSWSMWVNFQTDPAVEITKLFEKSEAYFLSAITTSPDTSVQFHISATDQDALAPEAATGALLGTRTGWHLFNCWWQRTNLYSGVIGLQIDNQTPNTLNYDFQYALGVKGDNISGGNFQAGGDGFLANSIVIDELAMWNRVLTSTERSTLWNNGSGRSYPLP